MTKKRRIHIKSPEDSDMPEENKGLESTETKDEASEQRHEHAVPVEEPKLSPRDADFSALDKESNENYVALSRELEEYKDRYLRALAELENYKKRALKERSELLKYQGEKILLDMVEVLDNLERALKHMDSDPSHIKSGLELVHRQFKETLEKWQVRGETALGTQFDPQKHHALSQVPCADTPVGIVINELKKTYFYKDRLLRAGEVVVTGELPTKELECAANESEKNIDYQCEPSETTENTPTDEERACEEGENK